MKRFKKISTFLLCGLFFIVVYKGMQEDKVNEEGEKENLQIVLKDEHQTLIPVNISVDASLSFEEKSHDLYHTMQSNDYQSLGLYPLIPEEVSVNGILLVDHDLKIDFTSSLQEINSNDELKMIEGLVWSYTQFEEVDTVSFLMDGEILTHMPHGLPISQKMDEQLGLNNFDTVSFSLHKTTPLTIYASKNILGKDYYVPITRRIDLETLDIHEQVLFVLKEISVSTYLGHNKELSSLDLEKQSVLENGVLTIHLSKDILLDDEFIDQKLLSMITLSLKEIKGVHQVQIKIDDQVINQQGDTLKVSDIISNPIKL